MKNIDIQAELAIIDAASISELKEMFRQEFGFDIQISNAETIKRRLQYRVQENICGGLTEEEIATLDRIADEEERNERKSVCASMLWNGSVCGFRGWKTTSRQRWQPAKRTNHFANFSKDLA